MFPCWKPGGKERLTKGWRKGMPLKDSSSQDVTVTWKEFSPKYVMPVEGACAALGLRALGVMPAAQVSTPSLFAKVSGQHIALCSFIPQDKFPPKEMKRFFLAELCGLQFNK